MKKLAIILAFLMLVPGAAFGLEMMNDSAMDDVTGQAGVSIAFDDVQIFMNIERIAWMDTDGFDTYNSYGASADGITGSAGAVGINNFQLDVLTVNAITASSNDNFDNGSNKDFGSAGSLDLNFEYGATSPLGFGQLDTAAYGTGAGGTLGLDNYDTAADTAGAGQHIEYKALSIDATSQLPALTAGKRLNKGDTAGTVNIGGVLIGLPTVEIYIPNMQFTPVFFNVEGADGALNDYKTSQGIYGPDDPATYGTVVMEGVTFTTLSGWMEIAPH